MTLTDDNFDEVVMQSNKDVMIMFYAPWCGHCKSMKPEYAVTAKQMAIIETATVAAMDATKYTVPPGFDVQGKYCVRLPACLCNQCFASLVCGLTTENAQFAGYPTLYLVRAKDKKNPIPYNGGRDSFSLVTFMQTHSSFEENNIYDEL